MKHNQEWRSQEEKIEAWLQLCDLSLLLKLEGIRLRLKDHAFAEGLLWDYMDKGRQQRRAINHQTMVRLVR